jgi:hypothetical protein
VAEKDGSRERRTRLAEPVDAVAEAADTVAKWKSEKAIQVMCVLLLGFLCAGFAAQLWMSQEQAKALARENQAALAAQIREANAREELRNINCASEAEKVRKHAAAEAEKDRAFWSQENAKLRAEFSAAIMQAIKGKTP